MWNKQYAEMVKSGGGGDWITASRMTGPDNQTLNCSQFLFQTFLKDAIPQINILRFCFFFRIHYNSITIQHKRSQYRQSRAILGTTDSQVSICDFSHKPQEML